MKNFLFTMSIALFTVFYSCTDGEGQPDIDVPEEVPEERKKPYSGWEYSEGWELWEGWEDVIEMTKDEFFNSEYMLYPETNITTNTIYYRNKKYSARAKSYSTSKKKVLRYTIHKTSKIDIIPLDEKTSISRYGNTFDYFYLLDTDIKMRDDKNGFFMDDQPFNTINVSQPGINGMYCYHIKEYCPDGIKKLKHYGKTFYAVEYSEDVLCRIVIVDK